MIVIVESPRRRASLAITAGLCPERPGFERRGFADAAGHQRSRDVGKR
jgi:hypothetical protein